MPKRAGLVRTFFKLNNGLGLVVIQSKVQTSPTRLGVRAFQSCQGLKKMFMTHLTSAIWRKMARVATLC